MPESAVQLLEHALERLDVTESLVHAYVNVDLESARSAAIAADAMSPVGPLHGWPFAVK